MTTDNDAGTSKWSTDLESHFHSLCSSANITHLTVAFMGGGKMAAALANGFISSGIIQKKDVAISVKSIASVRRWKEIGYENVFVDNEELLRLFGKGIVFLAVKPQSRNELFFSLSSTAFAETSLVVSIMGGVSTSALIDELAQRGYSSGIVRLMPNTAASIGAGASAICASSDTSIMQVVLARFMAETVGICMQVSEKYFDAATAVAGCGPAFVYTTIEAMADGGVLGGLDRITALTLAAQTVMGAARMVLESHEHPGKLKDDVCSPGGTTIYGLRELERLGARAAFIEAICASTKRSGDLQ